jgi:DNA-binding PadR family transcriptional regulator
MGREIRVTLQTLQVVQALLDDPADEHYGLKISEKAQLPTGSIYPILTRLEAAGWVTSAWEDIDESLAGRRARRYYQLTDEGAARARREIAKMQQRFSRVPQAWPGHLQPGGASA